MGLPQNRDHTSIPIRYRVWSIEMSVYYMCVSVGVVFVSAVQSDLGKTDR